jgi:hypothetical protein
MLDRDSVGDPRGTVGSLAIGDRVSFPAARGGVEYYEVVDIDRRYYGMSTVYMRHSSYDGTVSMTLTDSFRVSTGR